MIGLGAAAQAQTTLDTDGNGMNELADPKPVFADNTIDAGGAPATFAIKEALVENNFDYSANKTANDHFKLLVANSGKADVSGFSMYYSIKDAHSGGIEGYSIALSGFTLPAEGEVRIYLDDGVMTGHFRANPSGIYTTSQAAKTFDVVLKANGMAPISVQIAKDKGGAEATD